MRAVVLERFGGPDALAVRSVADPVPGEGDLLVRVEATSVNGHDLRLRRGEVGYQVELPAIPGIDVCGTVESVGDGVVGFAPGDRVANAPWLTCGRCSSCLHGRQEFCTGGSVYRGAYAELAVVPASLAVRIDPALPAAMIACLPNAYVTAWQMLIRKAGLGPEDVVFIWAGTSGLGSAAVEIARLAGATVIASAGGAAKLAVLRERGPDLCLDHYSDDLVVQVKNFTQGLGPTVVFDQIGSATWSRSLEMCAPGGTVVSAGAISGATAHINIPDLYHGQLRVIGSRTGSIGDLSAILRHASAGRFSPLIDSVVTLDEMADAHRRLEAGAVGGKIVVDPGG